MKYSAAIGGPDGDTWKEEIKNEHERMKKHGVFKEVKRQDVPAEVKIIDSTWACKKKGNGTLRGRLNARGFRQIEGQHYDNASISAHVINVMTIRIIMTIMIMAGWVTNVVDVKGSFLHGEFTDDKEIYMEVPQGWERFYPQNTVLKLMKTIHGLKQSAMAFWR
jgi:hypothetical protein